LEPIHIHRDKFAAPVKGNDLGSQGIRRLIAMPIAILLEQIDPSDMDTGWPHNSGTSRKIALAAAQFCGSPFFALVSAAEICSLTLRCPLTTFSSYGLGVVGGFHYILLWLGLFSFLSISSSGERDGEE